MDSLIPNIDLSKRPWPDDSTRLFRSGEPSRHVAWIPQDPNQWHRYAEGYKEAAERLYASWHANSNDCLVFPLVFLYRHYTELRIKELLLLAGRFLDLSIEWKPSHDIVVLWNLLSPVLQQIFENEPERDLKNARRLVLELATLDASSFEFRYPETPDGKRNLEKLERLDVVNYFDAMQRLSAFLDGSSMALSVFIENKQHLYSLRNGDFTTASIFKKTR